MEKNITKFYTQIKRLKDHFEELETLKGDNFNVFKLLNLQEKEEKFHTPFISNLLNPKGSHNQGSIFLELLIKVINSELNLEINVNINSAMVFPEKYIGKISKNKEYGGIIDILVTDRVNAIIIENKIYAEDQEKQLIRYSNYSKVNQFLFYLNLFGTPPNEISTCNRLEEGVDFHVISYKKHILKWLNHCKQVAVDLPILRESINQYINTLKELCGISNNLKYENNMEKLIEENFDLSIEIFSRFNDVKFKIIEEFRTELTNYIKNRSSQFSYKYIIEPNHKREEKYSRIFIKESKHSKVLFVVEAFSGRGNFNGDLTCGVLTMWDNLTDPQREILKDNNTKGWFPKKENLNENTNWNSTLKKLSNKKSRSLLVESIGDKLFQFISENEEFAQKLKNKIESVS